MAYTVEQAQKARRVASRLAAKCVKQLCQVRIPRSLPSSQLVPKAVMLALAAKAIWHWRGVASAWSAGMFSEADILLRALLETLITTTYIAQDPGERSQVFDRYSIVVSKRMLDRVRSSSDAQWRGRILTPERDEQIADIEREYAKAKNDYPDKRYWAGISIKRMASQVSMSWDYDHVYWLCCQSSHPSPGARNVYLQVEEDAVCLRPALAQDMLPAAPIVAAVYLCRCLQVAGDFLPVQWDKDVENALNVLTQL